MSKINFTEFEKTLEEKKKEWNLKIIELCKNNITHTTKISENDN